MKSHQVPAFGCWDRCDELPISQCFESAVQSSGLSQGHHCFGEKDSGDLFKVSSAPVRPACHHHHRKVKKSGGVGREKQQQQCGGELQRKQGNIRFDLTVHQTTPTSRAPKAVDEDLYNIPPELLYQKPKKIRVFKNLWSSYMGHNDVV